MSSLPDSLQFVLFGATGDLARSKLLPALVELAEHTRLTNPRILCLGRRDYTIAQFLDYLASAPSHPLLVNSPQVALDYVSIDLDTPTGLTNLWQNLNRELPTLYFFAMPPQNTSQAVALIANTDRSLRPVSEKVILDKPYGESLAHTQALVDSLEQLVGPDNLFLNDHYLYKDMVQALGEWRDTELHNMLTAQRLSALRLVVSEQIDLGTRASYFDGRGISVDWFQSHMLQMLATACTMTHAAAAKTEFISQLSVKPDSIIRGQYTGYSQLPDVQPDKQTETFLAVKLQSHLPTWQRVDFQLVCGKALKQKEVFLALDANTGTSVKLSIDPPAWGGISSENLMREYQDTIAYALLGDHTKFVSREEAFAQWKLTEELRTLLPQTPLRQYQVGARWQDICEQS